MEKLKASISGLFSSTKNIQPFYSREERAKFTSILYKNYLVNSVLDVGCSNKALKKWLSDDIKYVGVDIAGQPDFKVDLEKEKLQRFDDNSFHTVVCTEVLEHLENIHEIFDELCRVSNKYIIISLPNNWLNFKFLLIKNKGTTKFYGLPLEKPLDRHKWFFNYEEALNFVKKKGERNNFRIKSHFPITFRQIGLRSRLINIVLILYYRNKFGFSNAFFSSLWALLEKLE
ncbi:MAG: class I SAM-dependent methyltransferase [Candidatus Thorarchaeota archaeon]